MPMVAIVFKRALIITTLVLAISLLFQSFNITASIFGGALLTISSFYISTTLLYYLIKTNKGRVLITFFLMFKLLFLAAIVWLMMMKWGARPIPFLIGLTTIIPALVWSSVETG